MRQFTSASPPHIPYSDAAAMENRLAEKITERVKSEIRRELLFGLESRLTADYRESELTDQKRVGLDGTEEEDGR
jgi:transposase